PISYSARSQRLARRQPPAGRLQLQFSPLRFRWPDKMIVILFTGGTIAMRNDPGGGGAQPGLTPAEILQATRGIRAITGIETEERGQFPGPHMTRERMWALRSRIVVHLARPEVTGVVITHGTDTVEESAYLVARS